MNRPSPGGGPKNITSCLVTRMSSPATSGKRRGSQGPAANTNVPPAIPRAIAGDDVQEAPPVRGTRDAPTRARTARRPGRTSGPRRPPRSVPVGDPPPARTPRTRDPRPRSGASPSARSVGDNRRTGMPSEVRAAIEWRLEAVLPVGEPEHARLDVEPLADLRLEGLPRRARLARPARVERVRAVGRAQDAGLVPGRGARVAGPERIDERGRPARPTRAKRGPRAHGARADDDDVRGGRAHGVSVRVATVAASIASRVNGSGSVSRRSATASIWSL